MEPSRSPVARVVLLGASNLVFGRRIVVDAARARLGGPLEVLAAYGHGRSYGLESRFLPRLLPGIDRCGLWRELERRPKLPTFALATDVGNDIGFGAAPELVEEWLRRSLDRLSAVGAEVVVTGLPLLPLARLPAWEFAFWSKLFFPGRGVVRARALAHAEELDARLTGLARERRIVKLDPDPGWYGHDPIHLRRRARRTAWRAYLGAWSEPRERNLEPVAPGRWRGTVRHEEVRLFGREVGRAQPCARLDDGSTFSLY